MVCLFQLDKGTTWQDFSNEIPNVAVHDLVIQTREKDLIVGTHGRSLYKVNLSKIQQINSENASKDILLFPVKPITLSEYWGNKRSAWGTDFIPNLKFGIM